MLLIACANVGESVAGAGRSPGSELYGALGADSGRLVPPTPGERLLARLRRGSLGHLACPIVFARHHSPRAHRPAQKWRDSARWSRVGICRRSFPGHRHRLRVGPFARFFPAQIRSLLGKRRSGNINGVSRGFLRWFDTRRLLVVGQVALSMVLLIAAASSPTSLRRLYHIDPGFNPTNLLTMRIWCPFSRYDTDTRVRGRAVAPPSVAARVTLTLPMTAYPQNTRPVLLNQRPSRHREHFALVFPDAGNSVEARQVAEQDIAGAPFVAIVNESLARFGQGIRTGWTRWASVF